MDILKVFIVEDEFVVREGIKNNINWTGEGFRFCGEASDGELAYPRIQRERPDIIITDIRMPFMDGLELSRLIREVLPECKIIILSGYEEFRYAQEAIKIGVTEYLLKPISSAELLKAVKQVGQQIIQERREKENFEKYRKEMEETEIDMKRTLFYEMIEGKVPIATILERSKKLGLELSAQQYQILLLQYSLPEKDVYESKELLGLNEELENIRKRYNGILRFDRGIEGSALLLKGDSLAQLEEMREGYLAEVKAILNQDPMIRYFGGIGKPVSRLTHLQESFEDAARIFAHRFILDRNIIINSFGLSDESYGNSDASIDTAELGSLDLKKAEIFLRNGEVNEIFFFVEEFLKSIEKTSEKSFLFKQYILMNIHFTVLSFLKEIGETDVLADESFTGLDGRNEMLGETQKVKDYMIHLFTVAMEQRDALRMKRYYRMIEQAKEYIREHYADENISLHEVAAYVNISPSHFSTVFSRETGSSFIRYLTDLRMKKAKELLKCSDLRCSDISLAVGYKDPHYFSYLFKKAQNCSPMQYRALKG